VTPAPASRRSTGRSRSVPAVEPLLCPRETHESTTPIAVPTLPFPPLAHSVSFAVEPIAQRDREVIVAPTLLTAETAASRATTCHHDHSSAPGAIPPHNFNPVPAPPPCAAAATLTPARTTDGHGPAGIRSMELELIDEGVDEDNCAASAVPATARVATPATPIFNHCPHVSLANSPMVPTDCARPPPASQTAPTTPSPQGPVSMELSPSAALHRAASSGMQSLEHGDELEHAVELTPSTAAHVNALQVHFSPPQMPQPLVPPTTDRMDLLATPLAAQGRTDLTSTSQHISPMLAQSPSATTITLAPVSTPVVADLAASSSAQPGPGASTVGDASGDMATREPSASAPSPLPLAEATPVIGDDRGGDMVFFTMPAADQSRGGSGATGSRTGAASAIGIFCELAGTSGDVAMMGTVTPTLEARSSGVELVSAPVATPVVDGSPTTSASSLLRSDDVDVVLDASVSDAAPLPMALLTSAHAEAPASSPIVAESPKPVTRQARSGSNLLIDGLVVELPDAAAPPAPQLPPLPPSPPPPHPPPPPLSLPQPPPQLRARRPPPIPSSPLMPLKQQVQLSSLCVGAASAGPPVILPAARPVPTSPATPALLASRGPAAAANAPAAMPAAVVASVRSVLAGAPPALFTAAATLSAPRCKGVTPHTGCEASSSQPARRIMHELFIVEDDDDDDSGEAESEAADGDAQEEEEEEEAHGEEEDNGGDDAAASDRGSVCGTVKSEARCPNGQKCGSANEPSAQDGFQGDHLDCNSDNEPMQTTVPAGITHAVSQRHAKQTKPVVAVDISGSANIKPAKDGAGEVMQRLPEPHGSLLPLGDAAAPVAVSSDAPSRALTLLDDDDDDTKGSARHEGGTVHNDSRAGANTASTATYALGDGITLADDDSEDDGSKGAGDRAGGRGPSTASHGSERSCNDEDEDGEDFDDSDDSRDSEFKASTALKRRATAQSQARGTVASIPAGIATASFVHPATRSLPLAPTSSQGTTASSPVAAIELATSSSPASEQKTPRETAPLPGTAPLVKSDGGGLSGGSKENLTPPASSAQPVVASPTATSPPAPAGNALSPPPPPQPSISHEQQQQQQPQQQQFDVHTDVLTPPQDSAEAVAPPPLALPARRPPASPARLPRHFSRSRARSQTPSRTTSTSRTAHPSTQKDDGEEESASSAAGAATHRRRRARASSGGSDTTPPSSTGRGRQRTAMPASEDCLTPTEVEEVLFFEDYPQGSLSPEPTAPAEQAGEAATTDSCGSDRRSPLLPPRHVARRGDSCRTDERATPVRPTQWRCPHASGNGGDSGVDIAGQSFPAASHSPPPSSALTTAPPPVSRRRALTHVPASKGSHKQGTTLASREGSDSSESDEDAQCCKGRPAAPLPPRSPVGTSPDRSRFDATHLDFDLFAVEKTLNEMVVSPPPQRLSQGQQPPPPLMSPFQSPTPPPPPPPLPAPPPPPPAATHPTSSTAIPAPPTVVASLLRADSLASSSSSSSSPSATSPFSPTSGTESFSEELRAIIKLDTDTHGPPRGPAAAVAGTALAAPNEAGSGSCTTAPPPLTTVCPPPASGHEADISSENDDHAGAAVTRVAASPPPPSPPLTSLPPPPPPAARTESKASPEASCAPSSDAGAVGECSCSPPSRCCKHVRARMRALAAGSWRVGREGGRETASAEW